MTPETLHAVATGKLALDWARLSTLVDTEARRQAAERIGVAVARAARSAMARAREEIARFPSLHAADLPVLDDLAGLLGDAP